MTTPSTPSSWIEAFDQCKNYRDYLKSLPNVDPDKKTTAYLLTREDLDALFAQNDGNIDAVRVYVGQESVGSGYVVRLFAVACQKGDAAYDDWNVPSRDDLEKNVAPSSTLGRTRPCPSECNTLTNDLNTP